MKFSIGTYRMPSKPQRETNLFIPLFLILTLIAVVDASQSYYLHQPKVFSLSLLLRSTISKLIYYWYFILLGRIVQWYSKRIPLKRRTVFQWFCVHLTTLVFSFFIHETISLEIDATIGGNGLKASFFYLLFNNPSVWVELLAYVIFLLGFYLVEYRKISQENETRCLQLEMQLVKSKLQELRNRIRPTFLFKTLQTILELIQEKRNKDANNILTLLSDFLRTTVYDNEREEITLEEEMRFLNQYLEIEKVRRQKSFHMNEEIEGQVLNAIVPHFILQPLVEELIYQISEQNSSEYAITVKARKSCDSLELLIENRYEEISEHREKVREHEIVLDITRERLSHLYGDKQELIFQLKPETGTLVKIRIPFREMVVESEGTFIAENGL